MPPAPPPGDVSLPNASGTVDPRITAATGARPASWEDLIRAEATAAKVPPALALAVAHKESGLNPNARGAAGEIGLMQLMPATAEYLKVDPSDPIQNIRGGIRYLKEQLAANGNNVEAALGAYNAGPRGTVNPAYAQDVISRLPRFAQATPAASAAAPPTSALDQALSEVQTPGTTLPADGGPPRPASLFDKVIDYGKRAASAVYSAATTPPPAPRSPNGNPTTADLASMGPSAMGAPGKPLFSPQTQQMIGGIAGATAGAMLAPELSVVEGLPAVAGAMARVVPAVIGAGAGGAVTGGVPGALEQAGMELVGQGVGGVGKAVGRRLLATRIAGNISTRLGDAIDAAQTRFKNIRGATAGLGDAASGASPADAGQLLDATAQGPAKTVKDRLGKAVDAAAEDGPLIDPAPLRARLEDLRSQITPSVSHQPTAAGGDLAADYTPEQIRAIVQRNQLPGGQLSLPAKAPLSDALTDLAPAHPLRGALDKIDQTISDAEAAGGLPFRDAHVIKRDLDSAVNWDRSAKSIAEQHMKGFRQTLRSSMTGHEPYDEATGAYQKVAQLFKDLNVDKIHKDIRKNPEGVVNRLDWNNPSGLELVKNLTLDTAAQAGEGGARQGQAAWNAVRAAWSHENFVAQGPEKFLKQLDQMRASRNGQQFLDTMFGGDVEGQTHLRNMEQIAQAWTAAKQRVAAFSESKLAGARAPGQVAADIGSIATVGGHPVYKLHAASRLLWGAPGVKELAQWASYSDARTQFLIKHVLSGPDPGTALTNLARGVAGGIMAGQGIDQPVPSHQPTGSTSAAPVGAPPKPTSLQGGSALDQALAEIGR